jgi:hypothetical protein
MEGKPCHSQTEGVILVVCQYTSLTFIPHIKFPLFNNVFRKPALSSYSRKYVHNTRARGSETCMSKYWGRWLTNEVNYISIKHIKINKNVNGFN